MKYRSIGRMAGQVLFITIPAEIVRALGLAKADVVEVIRLEDGFRVKVIRDSEKPEVPFD